MKKLLFGFLIILCASILPKFAVAERLHELYQGGLPLGMGNAQTAIADDTYSVFYNPAGLMNLHPDHKIHYLNLDIEAATEIYKMYKGGLISAFKSPSVASLNALMGSNIYTRSTYTPALLLPIADAQFAVTGIMDAQLGLYTKNKALPNLTILSQYTNGILAHYSFKFGRMRKNEERRRGGNLYMGVGAKALWRKGGYIKLPPSQLFGLTSDKLSELTGQYGRGFGVDLGTQYIYRLSRLFTLHTGVSYMDIGDINFGVGPDLQKSNLSTGVALKYEGKLAGITAAYDYRNILTEADWRLKNHFGVKFHIPFVSAFFGINQVYATYGASVNFWFLAFDALSYAEEVGTFAHQDPSRRYLIRFNLNFGF